MEQFFTSLSKRQTMLLLTSLAFGGSEAVEAYEYLERAEEELLRHRAEGLSQIPREKRVPLLVQEIKRLVTQRRRQLASAEPKRLAKLLKDERPTLIEVVLNAVPAELGTAVRGELGNVKSVRLARDIKPEVLSIIRWKLEVGLRAGVQVGSFRFTDVMTLQQRELLAVADRMGARVLATAVAGLGDGAQEFLSALPPDQRVLAARAAEAGASRRLTEKDSRLVLEMHGALENPSLGLRSAGTQRIVRAAYAQSPDFAKNLAGRHQGDLGKLLARWLREEKGKPIKGDGGRMDIVEQLERLAQKGVIDRPMRLPPPVPVAAPAPKAAVAAPRPSVALPRPSTVLPPRRMSSGLVAPPVRRPTGAQAPVKVQGATRASKVLARPPLEAAPSRRSAPDDSVPTDSQVRQRVLRDGKPLPRSDTHPPRRSTSPVQPIPRRRQPGEAAGEPAPRRSAPLVKGPRRRGPT